MVTKCFYSNIKEFIFRTYFSMKVSFKVSFTLEFFYDATSTASGQFHSARVQCYKI
jgi:hypothetical protein